MDQRFVTNQTMVGSQSDPKLGWNSSLVAETGLEVSMWKLGLGGKNSYPERSGEPNCVYYMRSGTCGYGDRCRYNHPRDRTMAAGAVIQSGGEYPEREGQPVCEFFLKTGTCKFGAYCKYHHPKDGGQLMSPVVVNYYGYPLRPGENECTYYVKTGQCKFGLTCKFNHPQPTSVSIPAPTPAQAQPPTPAFYPTVQSPSLPSQPYGGVTTSWQVPGPNLLPGSYVQGAFGPVLLPQGMVPISSWSPYPAPLSQMSQVASPGTQPTVRPHPLYGVTQLSPSATEFIGSYRSLPAPAPPSSSSVKEHLFPERPGQPECQYYMRTGDCKYGTTCRYHHPPEWITPKTNCALTAMGLPLRPGAPPCKFYAQHGICKFGPTCKFDHPMGTLSYSPSASSLTDMPVAPYHVGSSLPTLAPSSASSGFRPDYIAGPNNSFSIRMPSSSGLAGSMFSNNYVLHSGVQVSGQSRVPVPGSISIGHGGKVYSST